MKKTLGKLAGVATAGFIIWTMVNSISDRRFARRPYETEEAISPAFTVVIPKGWEKSDYTNPRESPEIFMTSTSSNDRDDPYFVYGTLSIEDHGSKTPGVLVEEWRKGHPVGPVSRIKLGAIEADTWVNQLPLTEVVVESRTFVFVGANGHTYDAHYQIGRGGKYRLRQDYVFQRIIASMKFKPEAAKTPVPRR